jgi:nucleoid-associated protein YgaU
MARKVRKNKRRISSSKPQARLSNRIKFTESYTSLILGAIAVLVVGILFIFFAKGNRITQTSSTNDFAKVENLNLPDDSDTSSTYTVRPGDDLWTISERFYNNGFQWIEIAKLNKLQNPGLIYVGSKLALPTPAAEKQTTTKLITSIQTTGKIIARSAITENTYAVQKGDNLWNIAVRAYGDGFRWTEIAKANNLANPSLIHVGNVFRIPR